MIRFKRFLTEGGLTTTELAKIFATTGELRVTALADKIWGGESLQLTTGKKKKIKVISYGTEDNVWEYYADVPADKKKFLNAFEKSIQVDDWKKKYKLVIEKPTMKLRDLEKTEDFGGKAGAGPTGAEWESLITHQVNKEIGNELSDEDAKKIAQQFDFPHIVLDYQDRFYSGVIDNFVETYVNGETPIPCIKCNQTVKFTDLLNVSMDKKADAMVTAVDQHETRERAMTRAFRNMDNLLGEDEETQE